MHARVQVEALVHRGVGQARRRQRKLRLRERTAGVPRCLERATLHTRERHGFARAVRRRLVRAVRVTTQETAARERLRGESGFTFALETPRWSLDGGLFVFPGRDSAQIQSLYAYSASTQKVVQLIPGDATRAIRSGAVSADGNAVVYCVREGQADNLHLVTPTLS
jgi:hypothetical protein